MSTIKCTQPEVAELLEENLILSLSSYMSLMKCVYGWVHACGGCQYHKTFSSRYVFQDIFCHCFVLYSTEVEFYWIRLVLLLPHALPAFLDFPVLCDSSGGKITFRHESTFHLVKSGKNWMKDIVERHKNSARMAYCLHSSHSVHLCRKYVKMSFKQPPKNFAPSNTHYCNINK